MTEQERNEARHFFLAAPILLPLLERRKKDAINRLMVKHREGDTRFDTLVAEIAVLTTLEAEINTKLKIYETLEAKK